MKIFVYIAIAVMLSSCSNEEWNCKIDGKNMYSLSSSGKMGGAGKGCTCEQMRSFELTTFGSVDEAALASDFGC